MTVSGILILAEHRDGDLRPVTHELIAAAQSVRQQIGDRVTVAVVGSRAERFVPALSLEGVDEILAIESSQQEFDAIQREAYPSIAGQSRAEAFAGLRHSGRRYRLSWEKRATWPSICSAVILTQSIDVPPDSSDGSG